MLRLRSQNIIEDLMSLWRLRQIKLLVNMIMPPSTFKWISTRMKG